MKQENSLSVQVRKQRRMLDLTRQAFVDQIGCAKVTLRRPEALQYRPKIMMGDPAYSIGMDCSKRQKMNARISFVVRKFGAGLEQQRPFSIVATQSRRHRS